MRFTLQVLFLSVFLHGIVSQESIHTLHQNIEGDPDLEEYLREAIENFRQQMKTGIEAIHMPVLDPLHLQNLDINVKENLADMNLNIKQLNVLGFSDFNVTHLKPNLEELFVGINLSLPVLTVHGDYNVNGKFLKILPIYGHGPFDINATELVVLGIGKLSFTSDTLQMSLLKLDLLWKKLSVFMENFLGGGSFSQVLQRVVPNVGRDIFLNYKPLIMEKLESCLQDEINYRLGQPDVKEMIKGIIPMN